MITIIDYGLGNLASIQNMLKKIGVESVISSRPADIQNAEKLILPGVGAFDHGMENLKGRGLLEALNDKVTRQKTPILGICLGMQLFTNGSEEGVLPGLGWIDGKTVKFKFPEDKKNLKIPHMGWNTISVKKPSPIMNGVGAETKFYFVHSYYPACNEAADILAETPYGYDFVSAFERENIVGVQFHPEKSHTHGMQLLKNFSESHYAGG